MNLAELLLCNLGRRAEEQILRVGVQRERDDLADTLLAGEQHDHAVNAGSHTSMRRSAELERVVGVAKDVAEDIKNDLRANFEGECSEVGMYLAMARVAHREGYPEVGLYYEKAAWEEAEHAAKFAELLGEVVTDSTKRNLEMRVEAENGATAGKVDLATRAKKANLDAIHDTVHEMARDEARHGKAFAGLLKRYFGE